MGPHDCIFFASLMKSHVFLTTIHGTGPLGFLGTMHGTGPKYHSEPHMGPHSYGISPIEISEVNIGLLSYVSKQLYT